MLDDFPLFGIRRMLEPSAFAGVVKSPGIYVSLGLRTKSMRQPTTVPDSLPRECQPVIMLASMGNGDSRE